MAIVTHHDLPAVVMYRRVARRAEQAATIEVGDPAVRPVFDVMCVRPGGGRTALDAALVANFDGTLEFWRKCALRPAHRQWHPVVVGDDRFHARITGEDFCGVGTMPIHPIRGRFGCAAGTITDTCALAMVLPVIEASCTSASTRRCAAERASDEPSGSGRGAESASIAVVMTAALVASMSATRATRPSGVVLIVSSLAPRSVAGSTPVGESAAS